MGINRIILYCARVRRETAPRERVQKEVKTKFFLQYVTGTSSTAGGGGNLCLIQSIFIFIPQAPIILLC